MAKAGLEVMVLGRGCGGVVFVFVEVDRAAGVGCAEFDAGCGAGE